MEEETQRKEKEEESRWRKEEYQRNLAHRLEVDHVTAMK